MTKSLVKGKCNPLKFCVLPPLVKTWIFSDIFILKTVNGLAKIVDLDHTAPSGAVLSGSAVFAWAVFRDHAV